MAHATGGSQCGDGSRQHADDNLQDSLPSTLLHFLLHLRFNILVNNSLSWLPESLCNWRARRSKPLSLPRVYWAAVFTRTRNFKFASTKVRKNLDTSKFFTNFFQKIRNQKEKLSLRGREVVPQGRRGTTSPSLRYYLSENPPFTIHHSPNIICKFVLLPYSVDSIPINYIYYNIYNFNNI